MSAPTQALGRSEGAIGGERRHSAHTSRSAPMLEDPEHVAPDGSGEQLSRIRDPHLLHHIGSMCFHRLDANAQSLADVFVLQASPNQFENFLLAPRQRLRPFLRGRECEASKSLTKPWLSTDYYQNDHVSLNEHTFMKRP